LFAPLLARLLSVVIEFLLLLLGVASSSQAAIKSIRLFLAYAAAGTNAAYAASKTILLGGFPIAILLLIIVNVIGISAGIIPAKT
jgi:hypothetical protein